MGVGTGVTRKDLLKRVACGVMAGAMVSGFAACSTSTGNKVANDVTLQKALDDFRAGSTSLAKSEFEQVTKNDPSNKYAWYNLGVLAQYAGDASGSAKDYDKALAIDPRFESALYNYGVLKFSSNDLDGAISYLDKAIAENPQDANAHWNLGLALAKKGAGAANATLTKQLNTRSAKELNVALKYNPKLASSLGPGATNLTTPKTTAAANTNPTSAGAAATSTTSK